MTIPSQIDPRIYPDDGMAALVNYVTNVVDFSFGMLKNPMRDDLISETLAVLVRRFNRGDCSRNNVAVRYAVLTARNKIGLGSAYCSNKSNIFWNRNVVCETDTVSIGEDGDQFTVFDRICAPEPSREIAHRELEKLSTRLIGKDKAIFCMMIRGDGAEEIAKRFKVSETMARKYQSGIIAVLRKSVREEYDNAQHIINDLSAQRGIGPLDTRSLDDPDGAQKRTRKSCAPNRPERRLRRWSKVKVPRHAHRHDPEVVRTQRDYNRPRIRLEGRAGLAALRDLGLMRKST